MAQLDAVTETRSSAWLRASGKAGIVHRPKLYSQSCSVTIFDGRPVMGICTSHASARRIDRDVSADDFLIGRRGHAVSTCSL